jgi:putative tricarboxylic transport membrane protein
MDIIVGFQSLFSNPTAIFFVFLGALVGVIVGALPGLTAAAAIAMLVPVTFYLDPLSALAFLYVIGKSGRFGGSIAAILFNTPGTAASAATMMDGYPMTQKGQAGKALKTAAIASVIGDFSGELLLIFRNILQCT